MLYLCSLFVINLEVCNIKRTLLIINPTRCTVLRCCATNRKVAGSIPAGVSGFFIDIKSFRSHYGPGFDSASNRNENQDYFLGVKSGRCVRLTTLPPSCAVVTKSGKLKFLEPSGLSRLVMGLLYLLLISKQRYVEISNDQLESILLGWQAISNGKHLKTIRRVVCFPDVGSCVPVVRA